MAHHHVGAHPVSVEESCERQIRGEHGGLGDFGLHELPVERLHGGLISAVDEDVGGQRSTQEGRHHRIRLGERGGDNRLARREALEHVDVLRPLPGVKERDLGCRTASDIRTLLAQQSECRGVAAGEGLEQFVELDGEVGGIGEVHGDTHGGVADGRVRRREGRSGTSTGGGMGGFELPDDRGVVRAAEHEGAPKRRLAGRSHGSGGGSRGLARGGGGAGRGPRDGWRHGDGRRAGLAHGGGGEHPRCGAMTTRHVLLKHDMEVGAAESEGAHGAAPDPGGRGSPLAEFGVDGKRDRVPIDVLVGVDEVQAWREDLLVQGLRHLEQPGRARGRLEVSDVGLDGAEGNRARGGSGGPEYGGERGEFGGIPDARGGPVGLDAGRGGRVGSGAFPGAPHGELLTDGIGGGDALAFAVRRAADAKDDRIDLVAVSLGVFESFEDEQGRPFTHDEPVGARVEWARSGCRKGADLAELDERVDAHVAIDAAGDDGVVLVVHEPIYRGVEGRQSRRAGGIGREVHPAQVEEVRHPAGDDVRQLTGHRVLGDFEGVVQVAGSGLLDDEPLHLWWEGAQRRALLQPLDDLGDTHPHRREVVLLAADRVAEDDGDPVGVDGPVGPAGVGQRSPRGRNRPPLSLVHLRGDRGRDRQAPGDRVPVELAHPPADPGVGLVPGGMVRVEVERRVPAFRWDVRDGVPAALDVLPEGVPGRGLRHDGGHPDDGDWSCDVVAH